MRLTLTWVLVLMTTIVLGVGCSPAPSDGRDEAMPADNSQFVGNWKKITRSECSQLYPDTLHFQEAGLYSGQKDQPGTFTQWDVGTFEIVGDEQVRISLANDAIVSYEFSILNDLLVFTDSQGCKFEYRRAS